MCTKNLELTSELALVILIMSETPAKELRRVKEKDSFLPYRQPTSEEKWVKHKGKRNMFNTVREKGNTN